MGEFGYGKRSINGQRLIDLLLEHNLTIANSIFKKNKNNKWTWVSPDGKYRNEIDYIISSVPTHGRNLAEKNPYNDPNLPTFTSESSLNSPLNSFALLPTNVYEVAQVIRCLRDNCAVGFDQISGSFIKRYECQLAPIITHICNLAFNTGVFPDSFKTAIIKPIHKGGEKNRVDNFRPISILPVMSKILERLINNRLKIMNSFHPPNLVFVEESPQAVLYKT
ncbi:unnamed protein product [Pieris macdunnoughi]|uniref:Reverse transcriptase domain-containing protein n=1 Tax=Pieris macdunnoughi TaxID=345717 RepID=A0A821X726_9NEOP|nr:unnamed protein product [Pieris macdunnoughi]